VDEAFDAILNRSASEGRRFKAIYGVDVSRLDNFDLVLDTSAVGVAEAAALIARAHGDPSAPRRVLVSPRTLIPAFALSERAGAPWALGQEDGEGPRIAVAHARPFFFALSGEHALAEAVDAGDGVVPVAVIAEGEGEVPGGGPASSLVFKAGKDQAVKRWETSHGLRFTGLRRYLASHPASRDLTIDGG
jgi:hypothetical protein